MRLNDWQRAFEDYLLGESPTSHQDFSASLIGGPTLDIDTGLAIYHNAYRARLQEVLRNDFPTIWHWLGDEQFDQLAASYLRQSPSSHYNLRWLGKGFESFIYQHLIPDQSAPLGELARLEWAFTLAFDAPSGVPLTVQDMTALQLKEWPELRISASPELQKVDCRFNSISLWRAVKDEVEFPGSAALDEPQTVVIWRAGMICHYRSLEPAESAALHRMTDEGWSFAQLCTELEASFDDMAPLIAASWLKQWILDGWVERRFL